MKELSDAQRKLLESSDEGKLILADIEAAKREVEGAKRAQEAADRERKELQARMTNPEYLEALAGMAGKRGASSEDDDDLQTPHPGKGEEDVNNLDLKTLVERMRAEIKASVEAAMKATGEQSAKALRGMALAGIRRELDDLRDDVGAEAFDAKKEAYMKLSEEKPDFSPRRLWKELTKKEAADKAAAEAAKAEADRKKAEEARKNFTENPADTIAKAVAAKKVSSAEDAFDLAWEQTGAEEALKRAAEDQLKGLGG